MAVVRIPDTSVPFENTSLEVAGKISFCVCRTDGRDARPVGQLTVPRRARGTSIVAPLANDRDNVGYRISKEMTNTF
jgi:hypothetical protein